MARVTSVDPYSGTHLHSYHTYSKKEISEMLEKANRQFYAWRETSFAERKKYMLAAASELKKNRKEYAGTITEEMGKPISQAIAEIEKCAWACEYYAENAEKQLQNEYAETEAYKSYCSYEPLGVILAIMPWNYPFWQVFRFASPALMGGNIAILKHASNVFGSALNIERVFTRAGFPKHCFTTLLVESDAVQEIIENPVIKGVTLTGSGTAGAAVAETSGKHLKKTVLELGGSNALVVLKDCDIDRTVNSCIEARFQNTGQSCIAGKRLLIDASIAENFMEKCIQKISELKDGDPKREETYIGPLAREDLAITLEDQVNATIEAGAKLEIGGKRHNAFFEPTLVSGVTPTMRMFTEETFGPALAVTTFEGIEEAVELSNRSKFGLGVSIFTQDIDTAEKIAYRFDEGAVFINEFVKSDPRLPFGGIKESGYGRELSAHGIREFMNRKTIFINK